jgi:ketosteroid isomerase-like protein
VGTPRRHPDICWGVVSSGFDVPCREILRRAMSEQENIETLRRAYEAFSRGDFDTAIEMAHPAIEFDRAGIDPPIRGVGALRAWMEPDAIEDQRVEPLEFRTNGNKVLIRQLSRGRGAGSGIELEVESWAVWTLDENGLATHLNVFLAHQRDEALAAAGLRE